MLAGIIFEARQDGAMWIYSVCGLFFVSFIELTVANLSWRYAQFISVLVSKAEDPSHVSVAC